jgi:hypothetical protein
MTHTLLNETAYLTDMTFCTFTDHAPRGAPEAVDYALYIAATRWWLKPPSAACFEVQRLRVSAADNEYRS